MPKLVVTNEKNERKEFPLSTALTIGRGPDNHIPIFEVKASRTHCRVRPENGVFWIEDLDSSNGTKVNGEKVKRTELKNGDKVTIGATLIVFEDENAKPDKPISPISPSKPSVDTLPNIDDDVGGLTVALSAIEIKKLDKQAIQNDGKRDDEKTAVAQKTSQKKIPLSGSSGSEKNIPLTGNRSEKSRRIPARSKATLRVEYIILLGILGIGGSLWYAFHGKGSQLKKPIAENTRPQDVPPPVTPTGAGPNIIALLKPRPPSDTTPNTDPTLTPQKQPELPQKTPAEIEAEFTKLLLDRDHFLVSNNFLGARTILSSFVTRYAAESIAERARKELKETEELIEAALGVTLADAQKAATANKYRLATQLCTRLLSADPQGKFGKQAQDILNRLDTQSEPRYKELAALAEKEMKLGNLEKASDYLGKVTEEIGGTKWAGLAFENQLKAVMVRSLMRQIEAERRKCETQGKKIEIKISKRWVKGNLIAINGLSLQVQLNSGVKHSFPINILQPEELEALITNTGLTHAHLEQAYLWMYFDRKDLAQSHIDKALKDTAQSSEATKLASANSNIKNLKSYDFSKWQHQMDWEAISGSWSTQDDRYTLDSPEGGDTTLKKESLGGAFSGKNARISFDFELLKPAQNFLFSVEFGENEQHCVSLTFSPEGLHINSSVGTASSDKDAWTQGPTHVDLNFEGDTISVLLNGKPSKSFKADGLSTCKGSLTLRARDTACTIDNVLLRNVE